MKLKLESISKKKNLLAFSGGVDSSALFFILLENSIPFDIAIVDYNIREQSKSEVLYAKQLAEKYNKRIFIKDVKIENNSNFEKKARDIRYSFFEEIIKEYGYQTLITAHQLNDKLEWFLMQLTKGAGLLELLCFEESQKKETYTLFRPLINISRKELEKYLKEKDIKYFIDDSNDDIKYKRNYFRKEFSTKLLEEFEDGIKKSFDYLSDDINSLSINFEPILKVKELSIFTNKGDDNLNIRIIDKDLKKRGILLSKNQREEILKQKQCVISHKIAIAILDDYIFITLYENIPMPKKFKEWCRVRKVPKNIRAYIFKEDIAKKIENFKELFI